MKIVWISPNGDGWGIAYRLNQLHHEVSYYNPRNARGRGLLPELTSETWVGTAEKADLVVVDGNFDSRRTRRSFVESDEVVALGRVRRRGIPYVGPVPFTELLENDARYARKVLGRFGLGFGASGASAKRLTVSLDVVGESAFILRSPGHRLDFVLPAPGFSGTRLGQKLVPFFKSVKSGRVPCHLNVDVAISDTEVQVERVTTRFLYPAIFTQLSSLLSAEPFGGGLAITLFSAGGETVSLDTTGFFPVDLTRASGSTLLPCGPIVGAVAARGPDSLPRITSYLAKLASEANLVYQNPSTVSFAVLDQLRTWEWIP